MRSKNGPGMVGDSLSGGGEVAFQNEELEGSKEGNAQGFTRGIDD